VTQVDLCVVDTLCALALTAQRLGCTVHVCGASSELRELIVLAGLEDVLLECHEPPLDPTGGP
jgi:anti-anti-sigma regulatory factor